MSEAYRLLKGGDAPVLIIADHASNHVPDGIDLGIDPALLDQHIALDIGVAEVADLLVERLGCAAILGGVSRLVIDFNREEDAPALVPKESDGQIIPGNLECVLEGRLAFYRSYHDEIYNIINDMGRLFILSLHSFTPQLETRRHEERPWEIGILYNDDDRAARLAIPLFERAGLIVGDQLPYSGKLLNATMNRHAEANGIPYLGVEIRHDLIRDRVGQSQWAERLALVIEQVAPALR